MDWFCPDCHWHLSVMLGVAKRVSDVFQIRRSGRNRQLPSELNYRYISLFGASLLPFVIFLPLSPRRGHPMAK